MISLFVYTIRRPKQNIAGEGVAEGVSQRLPFKRTEKRLRQAGINR